MHMAVQLYLLCIRLYCIWALLYLIGLCCIVFLGRIVFTVFLGHIELYCIVICGPYHYILSLRFTAPHLDIKLTAAVLHRGPLHGLMYVMQYVVIVPVYSMQCL